MLEYVDFKAIKTVATVEAVAAHYGVELRRVNASHERGKCPLPAHPAGDEKETFSVNAEKQVWVCHSAICAKNRRGKKGGDVIELVAAMENCSLREAGVKLGAWFQISDAPAQVVRQTAAQPPVAVVAVPSAPNGSEKSDYEIYYQPLVDWIEMRLRLDGITSFEKTAYISVLGRIEEVASAEK